MYAGLFKINKLLDKSEITVSEKVSFKTPTFIVMKYASKVLKI
jgi:hypothetical protein